MKAAELRGLTDEALARELEEVREALFNLRFQHSSGALEATGQLGARRREVARIKTIMREREHNDG